MPASTPGLTVEQLQSAAQGPGEVSVRWELWGGCQRQGGLETVREGRRQGGLWEEGRGTAGSRPTALGLGLDRMET